MKFYIQSATKREAKLDLESRLKAIPDCIRVKLVDETDLSAAYELTFADNATVLINCLFDKTMKELGSRGRVRYQKWQDTYTVDADGSVRDESGSVIGKAVVEYTAGTRARRKADYTNPRTNVADTEFQSLQSQEEVNDAVAKLRSRQVYRDLLSKQNKRCYHKFRKRYIE